MKIIKSSFVLGLLLSLAGGGCLVAGAEDTHSTPTIPAPGKATPKKPVQQQLSGKVLAVDKYGKALTLQVDNLSYVLQVADATHISRAGRTGSITDLVVGQEITVTVLLRELTDGRVEVALLSVDIGKVEAQGRSRGRSRDRGKDRGPDKSSPFHNPPNPQNTNSPIVSPTR